jgi:hypothetical protein
VADRAGTGTRGVVSRLGGQRLDRGPRGRPTTGWPMLLISRDAPRAAIEDVLWFYADAAGPDISFGRKMPPCNEPRLTPRLPNWKPSRRAPTGTRSSKRRCNSRSWSSAARPSSMSLSSARATQSRWRANSPQVPDGDRLSRRSREPNAGRKPGSFCNKRQLGRKPFLPTRSFTNSLSL